MTWQQYRDIFWLSDREPNHIREAETNGARNYGDRELLQAFADELVKRLNEDASNTVRMTINEMLTEIGIEKS